MRERLRDHSARVTASSFRPPQVQRETGLRSIIGQRAEALKSRFGKTRIDLSEGDARKLQFAGETCVLDIYLYPLEADAVPVATHVEARRRAGGASIDKQACLAEIARR